MNGLRNRAAVANQLRYEGITLDDYLQLNLTRPLTGDTFGGAHHKRSRNTSNQPKE